MAEAGGRAKRRVPLVGILLVAAGLRLVGLDFGLPYSYASIDETLVTDRAIAIAEGDPNPHYFQYPSLWMYAQAVVFHGVGRVGSWFGEYGSLAGGHEAYYVDPTVHFLAARGLNVLMGLLAVLGAARLAKELCRHGGPRGRRVRGLAGLAAAALVATNPLHGHLGRFVQLDVPLAWLAAESVVASLKYLRTGKTHGLVLAAVFAGLGASMKYYGAILCLPVGLVVLLRSPDAVRGFRLWKGWLISGALAIGAFLATSPYVLLDWPKFVEDFQFLVSHNEGGHFGQEVARNGFAVYLGWLAWPWGGPVLLGTAVAGAVLGRGRRVALCVLLLYPLAFFLAIARMRIHFMGYLCSLVPVLAALGGCAVAVVWAHWRASSRAFIVVVALLVLPDLWRTAEDAQRFRRPDTRNLLAEWADEHLPDGALVATDSWLPLPLTAQCLEMMQATRAAEDSAGGIAKVALPLRRTSPLTARHLEVRLRAARSALRGEGYRAGAAGPTGEGRRKRFDLYQLQGAHMTAENLVKMAEAGFGYVVVQEGRFRPVLEAAKDPAVLAANPLYGRLAGFYGRLLEGDLVVRVFPGVDGEGDADGRVQGPRLVVCALGPLVEEP